MMKKIIIYDDYNSKVPQNQDVIGTVTTQFGNSAIRHGFKLIEICEDNIIIYDDYHNTIPKDQDVIGCVRPMFSRNALRASWKIIEVYE